MLWRKEAPRPRRESFQQTHGPASPSPAADGDSIFVFFGDFGLLAYGFDGNEKWRLPLGPFNNANGHGSSPIVEGDLVILICDQDTDSYLLAVDKRTGRLRWRTERPEVTRGYSSPVIFRPEQGPGEIVVPGSYVVTAYSVDTGEKLWWVGGMAWQLKSVAAIDGNMIYVSGWEAGGDSEFVRKEIPDFPEALAKQDSDRDGRLSPGETTGTSIATISIRRATWWRSVTGVAATLPGRMSSGGIASRCRMCRRRWSTGTCCTWFATEVS